MTSLRMAGVASLLLLFVYCAPPPSTDGSAEASGEAAPAEESHALVEVVSLETSSFSDVIQLTGETEPIRQAVVASEMPGRITGFTLEDGDEVEEGDLVLRVGTSTYGPQRDQLQTSEAQLVRDIDRQRRLIERGLGTEAELQALETQLALTRDRVREIDVVVRTARTLAPIDGTVVQTYVEAGEYIGPGSPAARIIDTSTIVVRVGLPEREIAFVHEGMEIAVTIDALGENVTGTLAEIGLEANINNRTFPLEIHVDNASGALRSGMRATVRIPRRAFEAALLIPRDAVMQGIDGQEVFVHAGGVAELRAIETGPGRAGYTVVLGGLTAGEELVVRGQQLLVDGEAVRTIERGPCCAEAYRRAVEGP